MTTQDWREGKGGNNHAEWGDKICRELFACKRVLEGQRQAVTDVDHRDGVGSRRREIKVMVWEKWYDRRRRSGENSTRLCRSRTTDSKRMGGERGPLRMGQRLYFWTDERLEKRI